MLIAPMMLERLAGRPTSTALTRSSGRPHTLPRVPHAIRRTRGAWVPPVSAALAGVIAVASLASTLTPNLAARAGVLPSLFHALTVPAGAALALTAVFLAKRRRRAWQAAFALLVGLGALHVLKGFDVEEAALSWGAAALLWRGRDAFVAEPAPVSWRAAAVFAGALAAGALLLSLVASWAILDGRPGAGLVAREALDLLLWRSSPPVPLAGDELRLVPLGVQLASLGALVAGAYALFRPHRPARELPGPAARRSSRPPSSRSRGARCASSASRSRDWARRATRPRCARTSRCRRASSPSSRRSATCGGTGAPSAGSRWPWRACAARTTRAPSSCWRATPRAGSTASCTSSPRTAARRCRWASCAAGATRPTA